MLDMLDALFEVVRTHSGKCLIAGLVVFVLLFAYAVITKQKPWE